MAQQLLQKGDYSKIKRNYQNYFKHYTKKFPE